MTFLLQTPLAWKTWKVALHCWLWTVSPALFWGTKISESHHWPVPQSRPLNQGCTGPWWVCWQRCKHKLIPPHSLKKYKQFKLSGFHFPNTSSAPFHSKRRAGCGPFHGQTRKRRLRSRGSVRSQGICWPKAVALCQRERMIAWSPWGSFTSYQTETLDELNASHSTHNNEGFNFQKESASLWRSSEEWIIFFMFQIPDLKPFPQPTNFFQMAGTHGNVIVMLLIKVNI